MNRKSWKCIIGLSALCACEDPQDEHLLGIEQEGDEASLSEGPNPAEEAEPVSLEELTDPAASYGACPPSQGAYVAVDASLGAHALALGEDGTVWAWGRNHRGQLGFGSFKAFVNKPQKVVGIPTRVVRIATGENHSLALDEHGVVWTWGEGANGQLGTGSLSATALPKQVPLAENIVAISGGGAFSLAAPEDIAL